MSQLLEVLKKLNDRKEIEQFASSLSVEDATELLFLVGESPDSYKEKIPSLLKGVSLFGLIAMITTEERVFDKLFKTYLKEEFFLHQLLLALEEFHKAVVSLHTESAAFYNEAVKNSDTSFTEFEKVIQLLIQNTKSLSETESRFLKFIWQTERSDLIERGSTIKEELVHAKERLEKMPKQFIEAKNALFAAPDTASAIDALPDLGISYADQIAQFAKELGLRNNDQKPADFILEKLQKHNLKTIKALKEKKLYSKALLYRYLTT